MTCPHLTYRRSDEDHEFESDRPYCTVAEAFVSPMRADVCNDRHGFDHASDCPTFPDDEATSGGEEAVTEPSE
jgi:hypothetical protein